MHKTSNLSVKAYDQNEDNGNESIYAWNNSKPTLRPESVVCPACNHVLPEHIGKPNCSNTKCDSCGFSIKLFENLNCDRENGKSGNCLYDGIVDDADFNDSLEYDYELEQPFYKSKQLSQVKRVKFQEQDQDLEPESRKESEENIEHMTVTVDENVTIIIGYLCGAICLFLICLCIAYARGEHRSFSTDKDGGKINLSLLACIFFFPYVYLSYVLVDMITSPNHGCAPLKK